MSDTGAELSASPTSPTATRLALANVYLAQSRWAELEALLAELEAQPQAALLSALLRARARLARCEFAAARALLGAAIARWPREVAPRLLLAQVHLAEGSDPAAAEQALIEALVLEPTNDEALRCLVQLHRRICLQWHGGSGA
jgi:hypothetical protein